MPVSWNAKNIFVLVDILYNKNNNQHKWKLIIKKHMIANEIVWIRWLLFLHKLFLSLSEVSVVFNISSSYSNTNLQEQLLRSKYSLNPHALSHSQSHVLGFHM